MRTVLLTMCIALHVAAQGITTLSGTGVEISDTGSVTFPTVYAVVEENPHPQGGTATALVIVAGYSVAVNMTRPNPALWVYKGTTILQTRNGEETVSVTLVSGPVPSSPRSTSILWHWPTASGGANI